MSVYFLLHSAISRNYLTDGENNRTNCTDFFFFILFNNEQQHKHKAYNLLRALDDSLMPLQTASKSNHYQIY